MFRRCAAAMFLFVFGLAAFAFAEPNMQDGKWEITMQMEMEGMPQMKGGIPPMKHTQCLTQKEMVPQQKEKNDDCKMISQKIEGNTVTWVAKCKHKDGMTSESTGKITYSGSKFDGVMNVTMNDPKRGGTTKVMQKMSGKRIGDCK
ncbi:MAG: DUF3617 family protein [Nitrospiraceae bacterium]|nr:DUF3617 family protein [Nitrospiraceae bacterium]